MKNDNDVKGLVFNIQGYAIQDGPGIRTTVFLKGCPLSCLWCSNPESQTFEGDILHVRSMCVKCGRCVGLCKRGAISPPKDVEVDPFVSIDHSICASCDDHACVKGCYESALEDVGTPMTVEEVMRVLIADTPFFQSSGGGVTLSGGEPLMSGEFVQALFRQCKKHHIHTAIETAGYVPWEKIKPVLEYTDLLLFDVKHMDSDMHKKLTGVPNELILSNLERVLSETSVNVTIRVPVIPGANDSDENIKATAQFANKIGVRNVDIMPYHRLGMGKYKALGRDYPLGTEIGELPRERAVEIQGIFQDHRIICNIGG